MAKHRQGRLSEEIKKSISSFLINGAKDPRLTSRIISITGVDVTRDGSYATVYVSPVCLSGEDKDSEVRSQGISNSDIPLSLSSSSIPQWITEDTSTQFLRPSIYRRINTDDS